MSKKIDFLDAYKKQLSQEGKNTILSKMTLSILVIYCLFLLGTFFIWSFLKRDYSEVNRQIEEKKLKIDQLRKRESLYLILKKRLSFLSGMWPLPEKDIQFLSFIYNFSSSDLRINDFKISNNKVAQVNGEATNALSMADFLEKITGPENNIFSKITLNSLSREKSGAYKFSLSFNL